MLNALLLFIPVARFKSATMDEEQRIGEVEMSCYRYSFHFKTLKRDRLKVSYCSNGKFDTHYLNYTSFKLNKNEVKLAQNHPGYSIHGFKHWSK